MARKKTAGGPPKSRESASSMARPATFVREAKVSGKVNQPLWGIEWIDRDLLEANDYNPNVVPPIELELLATSILENGWTQPIVALPPHPKTRKRTIVDGFHRWTVSGWLNVFAMTDGLVPVVTVPLDAAGRMLATVRHNRARGHHGVKPMSEIVRELIEVHKKTIPEVMSLLGMEAEEVRRLASHAGMPDEVLQRVLNGEAAFSEAWAPTDDPAAAESESKQLKRDKAVRRRRAGLKPE